jgi:hypothetical protein
MVEEFAPNYWKCHFSSKVLPRLNKGWKLVGLTQPYRGYIGGEPCSNCYIHGNGIDIGCNNYTSICNSSMTYWVCKDEIYDIEWWKWQFSYVLCKIIKYYI